EAPAARGGEALARAIRETLAWEDAEAPPRPGPIVLRGGEGEPFDVAYVMPVPRRADHPFASLLTDARALVLVLPSRRADARPRPARPHARRGAHRVAGGRGPAAARG